MNDLLTQQPGAKSRQHAAYVVDLCARIAAYTEVPGQITRTYLSPPTHDVHALLQAEMQALGMAVRVDAAGNLRGIYPGAKPDSPVLLMGSHIDTVPDGGAFDGVLGVALPLALLHSLQGRKLPYAIEVIAFSEEEGVRFKLPFIGSRAVIGDLGENQLALRDQHGLTLAEAIREFGLAPDALPEATLTPRTFAFIEVHIEQGPVLEAMDLALGAVSAIVGQSRYRLTFSGQANHAGTTPMHLRHDALAAAAEWIGKVERAANTVEGLVATVGSIQALPDAANVIAGSAIVSLDVRHASDETRKQAADRLLSDAAELATRRQVGLAVAETSQQAAVAMDSRLSSAVASSVAAIGQVPHTMSSGAGHDAMILARKVPTAMLFVRSPGGISHHPAEAVLQDDVELALKACEQLLEQLTTFVESDE